MKQFILTLTMFVAVNTVWSQARIPVNDPAPTPTTTKPTVTPTTNNVVTSGELTKYADPDGRFTIGYPTNWTFNSKPDNAVFKITSPSEKEGDDFTQNVNMQIEAYTGTVDSYVNTSMEEVKRLMKNYREVSAMYFNRNGARAYEVIYKGKYGEMTYEMQVKQLFVVTNNKAYILTYVSKADERDVFETTSNKIFNSFKYL